MMTVVEDGLDRVRREARTGVRSAEGLTGAGQQRGAAAERRAGALGERDVNVGGALIYERLLPAVPASVERIRGELSRALALHDLAGERRGDIALLLSEAASNAIVHAYRDRDTGPLYAAAVLSADALIVSVVDNGCGMHPRLDSPGLGLGLALMRQVTDALRIVSSEPDAGTCVQARFDHVTELARRPAADPAGDRRELLQEYLRVLRTANAAVRQDTEAVLAQAQQAVTHARRLQRKRAEQGF